MSKREKGLLGFFFGFVLAAFDGVFEITDSFAQSFPQLGETASAKDHHHDDQNNNEFSYP